MPLLAPQLVVAWLVAAPQVDPAGMVAAAAEDGATSPVRADDAAPTGTGSPGQATGRENAPSPAGEPASPATPEDDGLHPGWFYGTLVAAAVLGIAGATTGGMALGQRDEYSSALSACRRGDGYACRIGPSIVDDYELYATLTNVLLPCAGAFAIAALVLAFLADFGGDDAPPDDGETEFTFFGTSAGVGATLVLRF
ncbi:MAG: hypothetical protein JXB32_05695 [Deltaproteobacteria bacterium]|nr:hypothetical protein [Deltaproteobacteria bacterium]